MSTPLALAAVTSVLQSVLHQELSTAGLSELVGGSFVVSADAPDRVPVNGAQTANILNLFLLNATPNPGWRNSGFPSRDARGDRLTNPPLALDLHYLLTAYGNKPLYGEVLLGAALQALHENPVLSRERIGGILSNGFLPDDYPAALGTALAASRLAEQVEQLKITPQSLSSSEVSSLWMAFHAPYRPTAVYQVTAVIIESERPVRTAPPVQERHIDLVRLPRVPS
jgi:hypothetical protein